MKIDNLKFNFIMEQLINIIGFLYYNIVVNLSLN